MIEAAILDVDDTLCLTEAACFELENHAPSILGRAPMPRTRHLETWGMPLHKAMPLRSPGLDLDAFSAVYPTLLDEYVATGRLDTIADANLAAIDQLVAAGIEVMLLSSRTESGISHLLDPSHSLASRITAAYHADNTTHLKPDPRAFGAVLAARRLEPARCFYVGDSPSDAAAATGAGLQFIACLESGVRAAEDFAGHPVYAFIDTFTEVVEVVLSGRLRTATPSD